MTALNSETTPPLEGAAIVARILGVDESELRAALSQVGPLRRPVGLSLVGCISMQDTRQALGLSLDPAVTVARYLTAR
jgi:hypothetical protein